MGSCFHRPPGRALGGRMIGTPLQISRKKFTKIAKSGPAGSFLWIEGENLTQHRDRARVPTLRWGAALPGPSLAFLAVPAYNKISS